MNSRLLLIAPLLALTACAATPPAADDAEAFSSVDAELNYRLTLGDIALQQRDFGAAADAYLAAMELTDDVTVVEQATRLALHEERMPEAARAAARWRALAPDDVRAADAELVVALRAGRTVDALAFLREALALRGAPEPVAYQAVVRVLLDEEDLQTAATLMADAAADHDTAHAWHAAALVALRAEDLVLARRAIARARTVDPEWPQLAMIEARILTLSGDPEGGLALMRATVDEHADDPTLRFALGGLYLTLGREAEALVELERVAEQAPAYLDARWTLAMLLLQLREPEAAEPHLMAMLADPVRRWDVPYYMGGAHEMRGDWATALEWFEQVEWGDNLVNARIKAAQMLFNLERIDEGRSRLLELREEHLDERARVFQVEAELLSRVGDDAAAIDVLDEAVRAYPDSVAMRYTRALLRDRAGDHAGGIADLRVVHERMPDSADAQNALGYVLADRGGPDDWREAERLIAAALEQEPENAAYIDSMGWVLYRRGELDAAAEWLQRSWDAFKNPEVGAHLGEVLWQRGDRAAAREVWSEAAEIDAEHPVLVETMERLAVPDAR